MPSLLHETLLELFRNRPALAAELLRDALGVELPAYTEARVESSDLTQVQPTEYRADLVIAACTGEPVFGIAIEVQLYREADKRYSWPVYVTTLRARLKCPVVLLVVTADDAIARWASRGLDLGGGNVFRPLVLGPSLVPVITDVEQALADPELAVLSAMAHGGGEDTELAARIAATAQQAILELRDDRTKLYNDLILKHLSEDARRALNTMAIANYEYQSEFARRYVAEGRAEGRAEGKAEGKADLLARLLTRRFGPLPADADARLTTSSAAELDAIGERVLTAQSLDEALNTR